MNLDGSRRFPAYMRSRPTLLVKTIGHPILGTRGTGLLCVASQHVAIAPKSALQVCYLLMCRTGCLISGRVFSSTKFKLDPHRHDWPPSPTLKVFPELLFFTDRYKHSSSPNFAHRKQRGVAGVHFFTSVF